MKGQKTAKKKGEDLEEINLHIKSSSEKFRRLLYDSGESELIDEALKFVDHFARSTAFGNTLRFKLLDKAVELVQRICLTLSFKFGTQ